VIKGEGVISADDGSSELPFKAGESFFISAGKRTVVIRGNASCIVTHV
jgi:mannose-6-phosphate isomerase class I